MKDDINKNYELPDEEAEKVNGGIVTACRKHETPSSDLCKDCKIKDSCPAKSYMGDTCPNYRKGL